MPLKRDTGGKARNSHGSVIGLLCLLVGYLVVLMYAQGEYLRAIMTLILSSVGLYIFANRKAYAWR
ncbi:hypothetical protein MJ588_02145 [Klebsiella pneumoniae]|nr:hypothetical protein MJ588_02145 [Klebsiella pneumoniae]